MAWKQLGNIRGRAGIDGQPGTPGESIVGPSGPKGERGESIVGLPGPKGDRGLDGRDGRDGTDGVGVRGEQGPSGPPGKLPIARAWRADEVSYAGDIVVHEGGTWQAVRDTGKAPGVGHDWHILAAPGRNARALKVRGTYDAKNSYEILDIVMSNSSSFIALRDNPGPCPGDGWQMVACAGKKGPAGDKGDRGDRGAPGEAAAKMKSWRVDRKRFIATPIMTDGTLGPELELREFFEQFQIETR